MDWEAWILAAVLVLGVLVAIGMVDKPREPLSGQAACVLIVFNGIELWLLLRLADVL